MNNLLKMEKIKEILDEIANEPSTNQKMVILEKYKNNELLKRVLYMACSKRVKFYIKQIPSYNPTKGLFGKYTLETALAELQPLSSRVLSGYGAANHLENILINLSADDAYVIERIIGKDLKIGMGGNINKVIPGLIEETPYMGAKPFSVQKAKELFNKNKLCYCDVKMDGRYNNAIIRDGEVECESRQGETVVLDTAKFIKELADLPDCVLNGELTIDGEPNRYKANGIVTSLIDICSKKGTRTEKETQKKILAFETENNCSLEEMLDRIVYTVWDTITVEEYFDSKSNTPYYKRWAEVINLLKETTMVRPVEKIIVASYEQAITFFQQCLERGLEGAILKTFECKWKDGKPTEQMKMKLEMSMDLKITGFNWGTEGTKNENVISSLVCQSADGLLVTNPGGMDEKTMKYVTENMDELKDKIVDIKCSGVSVDRNGNYSLLHPRLGDQKFRQDKTIADTLPEILAIENMAKGLTE